MNQLINFNQLSAPRARVSLFLICCFITICGAYVQNVNTVFSQLSANENPVPAVNYARAVSNETAKNKTIKNEKIETGRVAYVGANVKAWSPAADAESYKLQYVERFAKIAVTEQKKYGIPASITLAQGILESRAGSSKLAKQANNHFGIKCFSTKCKKGHCMNFQDDSHKDFFRKYPTAWESYRAHSEFLINNSYKKLLKYGNDYKMWAYGLKKLGYATDANYDNLLINIIETYDLTVYD